MLYLAKSQTAAQPIDWCKCPTSEPALVALPTQFDCPWCGCGSLFSCLVCRKSFTVAEVVETDLTPAQLAKLEGERLQVASEMEDWVRWWTQAWSVIAHPEVYSEGLEGPGYGLEGAHVGERYVYLDKYVLSIERWPGKGRRRSIWGGTRSHLFEAPPQLTKRWRKTLFSRSYWRRSG